MLSFKSLKLFIVARIMTISSFFGVLAFYFITSEEVKEFIFGFITASLQMFWLWVVLIIVTFGALSWLSLKLAQGVLPDGNTLQAEEIKPIESVAMPTYIGLFVIALEVSGSLDAERSLAVLFLLLILWGLFERVFYFNPVWLLFKYRFYEARSGDGNTFTVISKQRDLKGARDFNNLRKINEYTYLE